MLCPSKKETNLEFSSKNEGIMHACGHDGHTAILLGAAELLTKEIQLPAPVRFLFQPAEEKGVGAKAMIREGVFGKRRNDFWWSFGSPLSNRNSCCD